MVKKTSTRRKQKQEGITLMKIAEDMQIFITRLKEVFGEEKKLE